MNICVLQKVSAFAIQFLRPSDIFVRADDAAVVKKKRAQSSSLRHVAKDAHVVEHVLEHVVEDEHVA